MMNTTPKKSKKKTVLAVAAAAATAALLALIANSGRICAAVQNPVGRAICETVVETAQEAHAGNERAASAADDGVDAGDEASRNGL